jgi:hypothetical protein
MAQGDTAVVRAAIGALNESFARGEPTEALLELCEADIRVDASRRMFNPEVYVGHEGMRRLIADVADAWKEFSDNVERIVEDGESSSRSSRSAASAARAAYAWKPARVSCGRCARVA